MLSRVRSKGFLLNVVSRGTAFVETLQEIGYPKVGTLSGQDFDWMFEDMQAEYFLEWFCHGVDKGNLLDTQHREEYQALLDAGHAILEGPALEEVLHTCREPLSLKGLQPLEDEEDQKSPEALEEELQHLRTTRRLLLQNRNKLQVRASELKHRQYQLSAEEEIVTRTLRKVTGALEEDGLRLDAALLQCQQMMRQLTQHYSCGEELDGCPGSLLLSSGPVLELYMELEQSCVDYAVRQTRDKLQEPGEGMGASATDILQGSHVMRKEGLWEELCRLRMCHVSGQWELLSLRVTLQSTRAGLQWTKRNKVLTGMGDPSGNVSRLSAQLPALEQALERLKGERLPVLLQDSAQCFSLPILQADLDTEDLWLQYISSMQEQVLAQLLQQQSRQEILDLALQLELRDHRLTAGLLEELQGLLHRYEGALQDRLTVYGDPKLFSKQAPKVRITAQDQTSLKLWEMLDDPPVQKQLFQKYDSLGLRGTWLTQEVRSLQEMLGEGIPQLSALEKDCEAFYSLVYGDSKRLMLNAQELSESLQALTVAVSQLSQTMLDILADLKEKNRLLLDPRRREERNLYTLFFWDPNKLREEVEALEKRAQEFSEVMA